MVNASYHRSVVSDRQGPDLSCWELPAEGFLKNKATDLIEKKGS